MNRRPWIGLALAAVVGASCGEAVPSPPDTPVSGSSPAVVDTPAPTTGTIVILPSATVSSPSPRPSAGPPYTLELGDERPVQEPGTIIFGHLPGPLEDARLEALLTWPEGGLTLDAEVAFGAYWGGPIGASSIRFTLYRVTGGMLQLVWSDEKRIDPTAAGYLDELVPFDRPGTYRLEATRDATLMAWGLAHMGPRCESNCSGG